MVLMVGKKLGCDFECVFHVKMDLQWILGDLGRT